jgi:hypothetical protein
LFTLVLAVSLPAAAAEPATPVPTTVLTESRPNPTEATILSDVDVVPLVGVTAGLLGLLSVVALRRDWI